MDAVHALSVTLCGWRCTATVVPTVVPSSQVERLLSTGAACWHVLLGVVRQCCCAILLHNIHGVDAMA
jgi:hypothetical protein